MKQGVWGESSKLPQRGPGRSLSRYSIFLIHTLNLKYDLKKVMEPLLSLALIKNRYTVTKT